MKKLLSISALLTLAAITPASYAAGVEASATGQWSSGTTITTGTLTCSGSGRWIVVFAWVLAGGGDISSVTGTGATFTQRVDAGLPDLQMWEGYASGTFSATVTATHSGTPLDGTVNAFCLDGPPSTSQHDSNAGLPVSAAGFSPGDGDPLSISTDSTNTILVAGFRTATATNTAGSGWTQIASTNYLTTMWRIASSPQTNLSVDLGTPNDAYSGIADAYVYTPAPSTVINPMNGRGGGAAVPIAMQRQPANDPTYYLSRTAR